MQEIPEKNRDSFSYINHEAEELRIRYKYRRLLVEGVLSIPYTAAALLIGPDSAYRLYGTTRKDPDLSGKKISRKKK